MHVKGSKAEEERKCKRKKADGILDGASAPKRGKREETSGKGKRRGRQRERMMEERRRSGG